MSDYLDYYSDGEETKTSNHSNNDIKPNKSKPVEPNKVLELYSDKLNGYEKYEILKYNEIYYIGGKSNISDIPNTPYNHGFDDEKGTYQFQIHDHIAYRYEIIKLLGSGAFGSVISVYDHKRRTKVALKIIRNKGRFHEQAKTEIKILRQLNMADKSDKYNFVKMKSHFLFRNHVCITFELLSINLYQWLKATNFVGCGESLTRRFTYSIVKSLCALWQMGIMHCDLSKQIQLNISDLNELNDLPENIVLREKNRSVIKLIDFGSSCLGTKTRYKYLQSRYYRAPEVILELDYGKKIDMWSLGCIVSELRSGRVLFKGTHRYDQLSLILELTGEPPDKFCNNAVYKEKFPQSGFQMTTNNIRSDCEKFSTKEKQIQRFLPGAKKDSDFLLEELKHSKDMTDFVKECLIFDPEMRMSPIKAFKHKFLNLSNEKTNHILTQISSLPRPFIPKNLEDYVRMKKLSIRD